MEEVIFGNVTRAENGSGGAMGRGEYLPLGMRASSPGTYRIKRNSTEQNVEIDTRFFRNGF